MPAEEPVKEVIDVLNDLNEDTTIPKNIRSKINGIISTLKDKADVSIRVNKALNDLDEIANDTNMEPYIRTQIWNIVSLLEKVV